MYYISKIYKYFNRIHYNIRSIRYKLKQIKNINCVIKLFYYIDSYKKTFTNTDYFLSVINLCYIIEPPSEQELQLISILYQKYVDKNNIEEYCITTLWLAIIYYIENIPKKIKRQNTWP